MKKLLFLCLIVCSCSPKNHTCVRKTHIVNTRIIDLNKKFRISNATKDGHEYILYEHAAPFAHNYCFFLEHKVDCKKCCKLYE